MAHRNIVYVSGILRHAVGAILLCWRRAARAAVIAGLIGFMATEIAAATFTHHFPATGASHLVSLALGALLAYGAGLTVFADELLVGIRDVVRLLQGEAEAGARAAAILAERETGPALAAALGKVGLMPTASGRKTAGSPAVPPVAVTRRAQHTGEDDDRTDGRNQRPWRRGDDATGETLVALASATSQATEPPALVIGQPVPAGQLPRIGWIDDPAGPRIQPASTPAEAATSQALSQTAAPITRPLPLETETRVAAAASETTASGMTSDETSDAGAVSSAAAGLGAFDVAAPGLAEPQVWHAAEAPLPTAAPWHDPLQGAMDDEEMDSGIRPVDAFGGPPPAPITRPLPENSRPPSEDASPPDRESQPAVPRSSVWDHISQVLAGRSVEPLPAEDEEEPFARAEPPESGPSEAGL